LNASSTPVFSRLHVNDIKNQKSSLEKSELTAQLSQGSLSIIEQSPMHGGKICLFSYLIKSQNGKFIQEKTIQVDSDGKESTLIKGENYSMLWTANYSGKEKSDVKTQTDECFVTMTELIEKNNMTLLDNTIRTWVFVSDIDNNYHDMVMARKDFFSHKGLTENTRYIASTGIEGKGIAADSVVSVDALSIGGLQKDQLVRMEALENLSPTIKYGVTFERGHKIIFGDREHFYLSGTASIDSQGELLHPGDVQKQTLRTLENIRALLIPHNADIKDMAYMIVYLRNSGDRDMVSDVLQEHVPENLPYFLVEAPVCRPGWLVEIEGLGIKGAENKFSPFL